MISFLNCVCWGTLAHTSLLLLLPVTCLAHLPPSSFALHVNPTSRCSFLTCKSKFSLFCFGTLSRSVILICALWAAAVFSAALQSSHCHFFFLKWMKRKISQPSKLTSAPVHLSQRAAHRAKPANGPARHPVRQESHHQHHAHLATQASWMLQSWPPHKPRWSPTSNAKPARHVSETSKSHLLPWLGPTENKLLRLLRPPTPDFDAQHDQACSAVVAHHLRVRALFPSTCFPQSHPVNPISSPSGGAVGTDGAHDGGTHCQLCATEKGQTIQHHFQSFGINHAWLDQVQVFDHHVRNDSSTSFPTNPRHSTFQSPRSTCQDSCPRARCSVVATRIKWTATPAGTRNQGDRKTKSAKEDHPEQLGWDLRESARRACGQCQPNSRPSLGPDNGHPG